MICFCSHIDASPDCLGEDVRPPIVKSYQGSYITLPGDKTQVIRIAEHPELKTQIGTGGLRMSFIGLPCPNVIARAHAFDSRLEWVSVQDMQKAVQTIVHLATI